MPEYLAVRCVECGRYQVQQRCKDGRFRCPACGARQSVQAVAGVAQQAKPLRELVQRLNMTEGARRECAELAEGRGGAATAGPGPGSGAGARGGGEGGDWGAQKRATRPAPDWGAYLDPEEPQPEGAEVEALQPQGAAGRYVTALPATARKRVRRTPVPEADPLPGPEQPLRSLQPSLQPPLLPSHQPPLKPSRQQQPSRAVAPAAPRRWDAYLSSDKTEEEEEEGRRGGGAADSPAALAAWADPPPRRRPGRGSSSRSSRAATGTGLSRAGGTSDSSTAWMRGAAARGGAGAGRDGGGAGGRGRAEPGGPGDGGAVPLRAFPPARSGGSPG